MINGFFDLTWFRMLSPVQTILNGMRVSKTKRHTSKNSTIRRKTLCLGLLYFNL